MLLILLIESQKNFETLESHFCFLILFVLIFYENDVNKKFNKYFFFSQLRYKAKMERKIIKL